jgi:hypothetical protein
MSVTTISAATSDIGIYPTLGMSAQYIQSMAPSLQNIREGPYTSNEAAATVLNHIRILAGNDDVSHEYMLL